MKADLTRLTFNQTRTRVVMQQGRVQLDADWNEQAQIFLQALRGLAQDLIGPHGGPQANLGFNITANSSNPFDFQISGGEYYVQGVRCQVLEQFSYLSQPNYPLPAGAKLAAGSYHLYLDVWERLITYVEDDSMREVALDGPDTAARTQLIYQVKALPVAKGTQNPVCLTVADLISQLQPPNPGSLMAVAKQQGVSADPCVIAPNASYRGPENQLYRIEIHSGGSVPGATFKWSRENGCVVFPIVSIASGGGSTTVTLESLGRDDRFGLNEGDWVEIQDDDYVLQNRAEPLLQVQSIASSTRTVTLNGVPVSNVGQDATKHPLLRRWDETAGDPDEGGLQLSASDNAVTIVEGSWLDIEDGIQIEFQPAAAQGATNNYRTGMYWLIPARTATGNIEWPTTTSTNASGQTVTGPAAVAPSGPHWYAPLAVINVDDAGAVTRAHDCRWEFKQLAAPVPQ